MPTLPPEAPPKPETRICRSCLRTLPLPEFRRRSKQSDRRMHECRECHTSSERLRRQKQSDRRRADRTVQRTRQLVQARRDRQFLSLAVSVVRTIGPNQFAADMKHAMDYARDNERYRDAKQLLLCTARLAQVSSDMISLQSTMAISEKMPSANR
jgi:hypothetical protein